LPLSVITNEQLERRMARVKRRLKRKDAWHCNYLDELVDSVLRIKCNRLANSGPQAQCKFLLRNGYTVDEIVSYARRLRKSVRKYMKTFLDSDVPNVKKIRKSIKRKNRKREDE
jgi:hypothetical protein